MLGVVILSVVARLQVIYWYKVAASLVHLNKAYSSKSFRALALNNRIRKKCTIM